MKNLFALVTFLLLLIQATAQNITVSGIPTHNQFPAGNIMSTFQDSEGYLWYATTKGGLYRDDGYSVKAFRSDLNTPNLLESNSITGITEDREHKIWFATKRGTYILDKKNYQVKPLGDPEIKGWVIHTIYATSDGSIWLSTDHSIYRYNAQEERLGKYTLTWEGFSRYTYKFFEDDRAQLWITQWGGGIFRFDAKSDDFVPYPWPYVQHPTCIVKDKTSPYYWVGTWDKGIVRFDPSEKDPAKMFVPQAASAEGTNIQKRQINSIAQDSVKHYIWTTTMDDLYAYTVTAEGTLKAVPTSPFLSPEKKMLHHIQCDHTGNLWISSHYPHSFVLSFEPEEFNQCTMPEAKKETGFPVTPLMTVYDNGFYWFWQMRLNLCLYQPSTDRLSMYKDRGLLLFFEKSHSMDGILAIKNDRTIVQIHHEGNRILESEVCTLPTKQGERIRTLHEDTTGHIWIGTNFDLVCYNLHTRQFDRIWEDTGIINRIASTPNGNIFAATESSGLLKLSSDGKKERFAPADDNYAQLSVTPDQNVWILTQQNRIYLYESANNILTQKKLEYDFEDDVVYDIKSDNQGRLWVLTNQTIIINDFAKDSYHLIRCTDPSIRLTNFLTIYKDKEGSMHVGGTGGVLVFPPHAATDQPTKTSISLTHIRVNGMVRLPGYTEEEITLQANERNLELFFSTFDPMNRDKVRFAFRYKGQRSYWNHLPEGQNNIYLAELAKGDYELEVRATTPNGSWSEEILSVHIRRLPAWYETWWAYTLYAFIFLFIAGITIRKYLEYQKARQLIRMEEQVSQIKYRFFTNVSHELRTPLTLIITPLETIIKKVTDASIRQQLESVSRNAQLLLGLVNQLLDFRKIEMGGEVLSLTKGDIDRFLVSIYENFQLMTDEKKLQFKYDSVLSSFYMFYDRDKLRKMVNNLLSNAIKFTGENGCITLSLREETKAGRNFAVICVEDTGRGIPAHELSQIFERFHQADSGKDSAGSGIGLHLVKEYATMHQGEVTVQSEPGKGSAFSIYIPTDLTPVGDIPLGTENNLPPTPSDDSRKKVLIVEDNNEFRSYMKNELSQYYTVCEAANGVEGEKQALETEPDILITDLMMPEMDGIELCRRIKNNIDTSHIPVILLTANDNIENEKRGYKEGADAYIGKPFHWDILLSRISNLMEQKLQRQQAFEKNIEVHPDTLTISAMDEQFLSKALEVIEKNMGNSEYSIEDLSRDMAMSRVSLYRKINSITGNTPTDFVKNIRLKRAAELLKEGKQTVAEVAYSVGFSTPGYFTQSFKKAFGVLPTQYK